MVNEKLTQVDEACSPRQSKLMNYRHAFHAGNHGDVLKHVLLARVLTYLTQTNIEIQGESKESLVEEMVEEKQEEEELFDC